MVWFGKPVFSNLNRYTIAFRWNILLQTKSNTSLKLFSLGPHIPIKQNRHRFLPWSTISAKLHIYFYNYKDANICKSLGKPVWFVIIKYLIECLAYKTLFINPYVHHNFVTITETKLSLFCACTHCRDLPR